MTKQLVFFVSSLIAVIFAGGCPSENPKPVDFSVNENIKTESPDEKSNTFIEVESKEIETKNIETDEISIIPADDFFDKFTEILKNFVDNRGMVNYRELRRERLELVRLLNEFNDLEPDRYKSWSREDKIAFWINVYNLQKIKIVTDNYPIQSSRILRVLWGLNDLRHIEKDITQHKFLVMDEEFTFKKIEQRFFRQEFDDPRIFLALSDACLSSPPLLNEPYYGSRLDEQLDDQISKFLSSPLAFKIDRDKNRIYLSAAFEHGRFGKEFIQKYSIDRKFKDHPPEVRAVLNFVSKYISDKDVPFLEVGNYSIHYMKYDWTINDGS
jgi:hypothetical protein